jgi:hypothetical protein
MRVIEGEGADLSLLVVAVDIGCTVVVLGFLVCLGISTSFLQCRQNILH